MKKKKKLHGVVEKVIKPVHPRDVEKAQIHIKEADELYREVRLENTLTDEDGEKIGLKPGAEVDVVIEADSNATIRIRKKSD
jgi:predicted DNA-binding antitoxin AbrB/MazE fold protein